MTLSFINQIIKTTIVLSLGCLLFSFFDNVNVGIGIVVGAALSCVNLILIKNLLQNILILKQKDYLKLFTLFGIKFPLLYFAGYQLLKLNLFPIISILIGFSIIFIVIFLIGIKRLFAPEPAKDN